MFTVRHCLVGRKDITAATQRQLISETRPWAKNGCTVMDTEQLLSDQPVGPTAPVDQEHG